MPTRATTRCFRPPTSRLSDDVENLVLRGSADLQGYGNSLSNALYGNSGNNILNGDAGAPTSCSGAVPATMPSYSTWGRLLATLSWISPATAPSPGDWLLFVGYGAGATFTDIDTTHWEVNYNGGALHEIITFNNAASIDPGDFTFI